MPGWETKPSTDCTRCSSGSSADRDSGYLAMISSARACVRSSKTTSRGEEDRNTDPPDSSLTHRSTPPITGSIDATAATTSAIIEPSAIAGIACRFTKPGSRRCTRHGRVPPEDTTWQPSSPRGFSMPT